MVTVTNIKKQNEKEGNSSRQLNNRGSLPSILTDFAERLMEQKQLTNEEHPKRRIQPKTVAVWVLTVLVVIISASIVLSRMIEYSRLKQSIQKKQDEITASRERIEELEYWLDAPVDYDYIIKVAREEIGLHFPDEDIYYTDDSDQG